MNCEICGKPIEGRPIRTNLLRGNLFQETKREILKDLKQTGRMFKEDAEKNLWMNL